MAKYRSIVILTGAGISAESGIPTFRGPDGLWEGHRVEEVATPEAFARNPALVQRFYNLRRAALHRVEPNPAHRALARLEQAFDGEVVIVTQNVDDLHERAGSRNVIHMHGELRRAWCLGCDGRPRWEEDILETSRCPHCSREGRLRPDIVWFGEIPYHMDRIDQALSRCDLFVSIGTSGNVYPAAGFVALVRHMRRAYTVELNLDPSECSSMFHENRHGPASQLVPAFVEEVLGA